MDLNEVRVAEDKDFEVLKIFLSRNDGWTLEYQQAKTSVWTRHTTESDFKMIRVGNVLVLKYLLNTFKNLLMS